MQPKRPHKPAAKDNSGECKRSQPGNSYSSTYRNFSSAIGRYESPFHRYNHLSMLSTNCETQQTSYRGNINQSAVSQFHSVNANFPAPPSFRSTRQTPHSGFFYHNSTRTLSSSSASSSFVMSSKSPVSLKMQRQMLSTSQTTEKGSSISQSVGNAPEPICISSEESDVEEITTLPEAPIVVPKLSLGGRDWEELPHDSDDSTSALHFTVMSYNILSQQLLMENSYLYRTCPPSELQETRRVTRIIDDLVQASPDVMCLQEVETKLFYEKLKPLFESLGYHCLYKKRTGYKPDGCALFISSKKFDIESYREVEFYQPDVDLLDRDNVGIVAVVEVKSSLISASSNKTNSVTDTPARIVIATTHLLFNQRRGDIKLAQVQYLMAKIDHMALFGVDATSGPCRLLVYYPILICGDMNIEPNSALYNFIAEGYLKYEGIPRSVMSGQTTSFGPSGPGPVMSRTLLPDSFGLADNSEFAESCTLKNSMNSCINAITGGPVVADVEKDVTRQMNSTDRSQVRKYYSGVATHPFFLRAVYEYDTRGRGDFTSMTRGHPHAVDHMFYSIVRSPADMTSPKKHLHEGRLHLLRRLRVPNADVIKNGSIPQPSPSLPTYGVPSDHIPLMAEFRFEIPRLIAVPPSTL